MDTEDTARSRDERSSSGSYRYSNPPPKYSVQAARESGLEAGTSGSDAGSPWLGSIDAPDPVVAKAATPQSPSVWLKDLPDTASAGPAAPSPEPRHDESSAQGFAPTGAGAPAEDEVLQLRRLIDTAIIRLQEQYGREQSALTDVTRSMLTRIEALEAMVEDAGGGQATAPRLDAFEQKLAEVDRRARIADELATALNRYKSQHDAEPQTDAEGRVDLNAASFEELRALGLSVTQAARLVAHRDACGGFTSKDQLAELPGLPKPLLASLLERGRL